MSEETTNTNNAHLGLELSDFAQAPSMWRVFWNEIVRDKAALIALFLFIAINIAVFALAATMDPVEARRTNTQARNLPPSEEHFMGTDPVGRDMWNQLILGARNSLLIAYGLTAATGAIGVFLGLFSGVKGGHVDNIIMRVVDTWTMLPAFMIIIVIATVWSVGTPLALMGVLIAFGWAGRTRFLRAVALQQGSMDYVAASKTLGTRNMTIIFREVMPNMLSTIVVNLVLGLAFNIGIETGLSILGFGLTFDTPSLGTLIGHSLNPAHMQNRWWLWVPAVILIVTLTLSINAVGQALNRAADAKRRRA